MRAIDVRAPAGAARARRGAGRRAQRAHRTALPRRARRLRLRARRRGAAARSRRGARAGRWRCGGSGSAALSLGAGRRADAAPGDAAGARREPQRPRRSSTRAVDGVAFPYWEEQLRLALDRQRAPTASTGARSRPSSTPTPQAAASATRSSPARPAPKRRAAARSTGARGTAYRLQHASAARGRHVDARRAPVRRRRAAAWPPRRCWRWRAGTSSDARDAEHAGKVRGGPASSLWRPDAAQAHRGHDEGAPMSSSRRGTLAGLRRLPPRRVGPAAAPGGARSARAPHGGRSKKSASTPPR